MAELTITTFLSLVRSGTTGTGTVISVYRRAGERVMGSFGLEDNVD